MRLVSCSGFYSRNPQARRFPTSRAISSVALAHPKSSHRLKPFLNRRAPIKTRRTWTRLKTALELFRATSHNVRRYARCPAAVSSKGILRPDVSPQVGPPPLPFLTIRKWFAPSHASSLTSTNQDPPNLDSAVNGSGVGARPPALARLLDGALQTCSRRIAPPRARRRGAFPARHGYDAHLTSPRRCCWTAPPRCRRCGPRSHGCGSSCCLRAPQPPSALDTIPLPPPVATAAASIGVGPTPPSA